MSAEDLYPELYRPGRFYLVAAGLVPQCGRLPIPLPPNAKPRGTWAPGSCWRAVDITFLVQGGPCRLGPACRPTCPLSERIASIPREAGVPYLAGLVWIPKAQYPLPGDWVNAVDRAGVRWPVPQLPVRHPPKPKMLVLVAHPRGIIAPTPPNAPITPAIVYAFRIEGVEYVMGARADDRRLRHADDLGVAVRPRPPIVKGATTPGGRHG